MKIREPVQFQRGLQDTSALSSRRPDDFDRFQDVEVDHGGIEVRKGMVRLAKLTNTIGILNFDATDDVVNLPANTTYSNGLGLVWTIEMLFQTDTLSADRAILGPRLGTGAGFLIKHTTAETVTVLLTDAAAGTLTLTFTGIAAGTLCALQVARNGASVTGWLNGTTQSGSMSATESMKAGPLCIGANFGADWFDGRCQYLRMWSVARSTQCDIYRPTLNPRNRNLLFEWVLNAGPQNDVIDRGVRCAHAQTAGSPSFAGSPLVDVAAVQGMGYRIKADGTKELLIAAFGRHYAATVT